MREKLLALLKEVKSNVNFEKEKYIIDDGLLDSFDIINVVRRMEDTFDVEIDIEELEPDNFNTIEGMIQLIQKLQNE